MSNRASVSTRVATVLYPAPLRLAALLWTAVAGAAGAGGPTLEALPKSWRVANAHYTAILLASGGGLISELRDAQGRRLLDRFEIYTDSGLYEGRRTYTSRCDERPRAAPKRHGGRIVHVSEGRLILKEGAGKEPDYPLIRYRVELTFDDSPAIRVAMTLTPELTAKPPRAFLAHTVGVADAPELFANTADGFLCQDAATRSARTWQSRHDPLDRKRPAFGVCTKHKTCLVFTDIRSSSGLANVFVHESGEQSLAAFFAWRDGRSPSPIVKGQKLDLAYTIRILNGPDDLSPLIRLKDGDPPAVLPPAAK